MTLAWTLGSIVAVVLVVLGIPWFSDRMTRGNDGPSAGSGALGALDGVFNPGAARAQTSISQEKEKKGSQARGEGDDEDEEAGETRG